jgi:DNA-binding response OmpR family regulator
MTDAVPATILIIEDDADIRLLLETLLTRAGHRVVTAENGSNGLRLLFQNRPDAMVLDLGLPDIDGFEVLARVREVSDVPLLVLTARGLEADKVRGLHAGADDYLTKPFGNQELTARVGALLRRRPAAPDTGDSAELAATTTDDGTVKIDHATRLVTVSGREVQLTPIEFRLVNTFTRHPGQVLSATQLLEQVWGDPTGVAPDRVKFAVLRLRRQLGWTGDGPIEAVRGFGYRYRPDPTRPDLT